MWYSISAGEHFVLPHLFVGDDRMVSVAGGINLSVIYREPNI